MSRKPKRACLVTSRRGPGWSCGADHAQTDDTVLRQMVRRIRRSGLPVWCEPRGWTPTSRAVSLTRRWFRGPGHVTLCDGLHRDRGECLVLVRTAWQTPPDRLLDEARLVLDGDGALTW